MPDLITIILSTEMATLLKEFDPQNMNSETWRGEIQDRFILTEATMGRKFRPEATLVRSVLENAEPDNEGVGLSVRLLVNDEYRRALAALDDYFNRTREFVRRASQIQENETGSEGEC